MVIRSDPSGYDVVFIEFLAIAALLFHAAGAFAQPVEDTPEEPAARAGGSAPALV